ncbi:MAG: PAS domain S-box protein, partial [Actinomycetota bacterium]|nr:PAS domain S-box protein [Actinomycetota bacterium]
ADSEATLYQIFLRSGMEAAAIASIVGGGLALLLAVLLSRRVERLTVGARSIERGNLSHRIETRFNDELGELGATFNSMAAKLQDSFTHLENRVTERTAELEAERARLEAVLRQMPSGVTIAEAPSGKILLSNERAQQIRGHSIPQVVGVAEYDKFMGCHPDGRAYEPQEWPLARTIGEGEEVVGEEIVVPRSDGAWGTIRVNSSPICDRDGHIVAGVAVFSDITEEKQAQETIRASEERFRATFEQAAVGVAHVSLAGKWLRVNQRLCDIVGYSREELQERTFQDITHPEDLDADLENVRQLLAGQVQTYSMEKRYLRKDGSFVWVNLTVSLVHEPSGDPKYLIAVVEDIEDRKKMESALRENEERFRLITENAHDLICMMDMEGRFVYVSPSYEAVLGYCTEELLEVRFTDLVYTEDLSHLEDWQNTTQFQFRACKADGSWVWMEGSSYTVSWHGEPYVVGIARDVTERKRVEEEIRQLNEELEQRVRERTVQLEQERATLNAILDNLAEGVLAADSQDRTVFANPAARAMLNVDRGRTMTKLPSPWKDFDLPSAVARCMKERECVEARVREGDSFLHVRLEHLPVFDENGGGVLVVVQDLSEGRRLEANQQRFLANAAHELKTPITTILGASELLLTESEDDPEIRHRFLNHIFSEAGRMQRLSETLLRLARTGVDLRDPEAEILDLDGVAREAVGRIDPLAESAGIDTRVDGRGGRVLADYHWFEQVLLVVLGNAVQHSEHGGMIRVHVKGGTVTVEDEGSGISEADLPYVFERFYRGKRSFGGFGLGLAICKDLVERMGGSISLHSREGVGTRVEIELPEVGNSAEDSDS